MAAEQGTQHWLLLRGLGRERRHWGAFTEQFSQAMPHAQLHCIDLPGNGCEYWQRSLASIPEMVDWLRNQPRPPGPVYLLGLSLGGMLAWHWMQHWPQEVAAVVMVNSSLAPLCAPWQRLKPAAVPCLIRAILQSGTAREGAVFDLTCRNVKMRSRTVMQWRTYLDDAPVTRLNLLRQLWAAGGYRAGSAVPERPVLVASGTQDQLVNAHCSTIMAEKWGAPLVVHPLAGHDLPYDQGEWLCEQIAAWVAND